MYLLFSGEGPTDMGQSTVIAEVCEGADFLPGPMAWFVDQWVERKAYLSHIGNDLCGFIPKPQLVARAKASASKKSIGLRGKKNHEHETRYYYNNARAMAKMANDKSIERDGDTVVAILFRDGDGTQSSGRGEWLAKCQSMKDGFLQEGFLAGVPMIPKPKSEAWLLCAVRNHYQHCERLEDESGNDRGQNPLKDQLNQALGDHATRELLAESVQNRTIDIEKITDMPSLNRFKERLDEILDTV